MVYRPEKNLRLETYSQMIPVPKTITNVIREDTPKDYEFIETGYGVTISQIMSANLQARQLLEAKVCRRFLRSLFIFFLLNCIFQVHPSELQETLTGLPRRQRILSATQVIANLYKNALL